MTEQSEWEKPQIGDDLQLNEDFSKVDLPVCTYLIPLRIESADRMRNIITSVCYLLKNIDAPIIIKEFDKESIYESAVLPQLKIVCSEEELKKITHVFEQTDEFIFHRTRLINDMVMMADTPFVCNHDSDIILPTQTHFFANTFLKNGYLAPDAPEGTEPQDVECVYPYGYGDFQLRVFADDQIVSKFINSNFNFHAFDGKLKQHDAKFGFAQFFDREEYIRLGMENEKFISYGYEDDERFHRFNTCSKVIRINDYIYHLEHERTQNSWFTNPHIEDNRKEWEKLKFYGKKALIKYYENIDYMKVRRGQEQK